jgi:hypothetical protein
MSYCALQGAVAIDTCKEGRWVRFSAACSWQRPCTSRTNANRHSRLLLPSASRAHCCHQHSMVKGQA